MSAGDFSMGLFDGLVDSLLGQFGDKDNNLLGSVLDLINNPQSGGIAGLMKSFQDKGFGDMVSSWISTGQNLPISGQQIQSVLGNEQIQGIASKLGISLDDASQSLANLLPQVVDKLTPDGNMPDNALLEQGLSLLKSRFMGGK
jgi:uncharacterized protein YidB (DUF937 family)